MTVTFNGAPDDLLTYTSPSAKLCLGPAGTYRYAAHNLYVNSASPANQSITVVSGASYSVTITGSVSVTASGAATGTWTSGTNTFTAATGTLTLGSTSGAGTVHVRRTPSDITYLATTASARYGLPYEWNTSGVLQGIRIEEARTNLFLNSRSAATQTVTVTNAISYTVSFFGTGSITFSGANSSTLNGTGASDRVSTTFTTGSTSLTCTVSGSIDLVQVEAGAFATSPIETFGATVTRAVDTISLATSAFPWADASGTFFVMQENASGVTGGFSLNASTSSGADATGHLFYRSSATVYTFDTHVSSIGTGTITRSSWVDGAANKVAYAYATDDFAGCLNGGTVGTDVSGAVPTGITWLGLGARGGSSTRLNGYLKKIMYVPRRMSNAELQALTT